MLRWGRSPYEGRPTVEDVVAASPFESIRSAEIVPLFERGFRSHRRNLGGTIQHLLHNGIIHNSLLGSLRPSASAQRSSRSRMRWWIRARSPAISSFSSGKGPGAERREARQGSAASVAAPAASHRATEEFDRWSGCWGSD
jgi:hypothetical protein